MKKIHCERCGLQAKWVIIECDELLDFEIKVCDLCYWTVSSNMQKAHHRVQAFNIERDNTK